MTIIERATRHVLEQRPGFDIVSELIGEVGRVSALEATQRRLKQVAEEVNERLTDELGLLGRKLAKATKGKGAADAELEELRSEVSVLRLLCAEQGARLEAIGDVPSRAKLQRDIGTREHELEQARARIDEQAREIQSLTDRLRNAVNELKAQKEANRADRAEHHRLVTLLKANAFGAAFLAKLTSSRGA